MKPDTVGLIVYPALGREASEIAAKPYKGPAAKSLI